MATEVMVPGILVALKTSVNGGVQYQRKNIERDEEGKIVRWETTRFMEDPEERKKAGEIASKATRTVDKLCIRTTFGLLCRSDKEADLDNAIVEARAMAQEFNAISQHTFIRINAIKGRIADNDEEAIRAILQESKDLLEQMDRGLSEGDVRILRDAANRARRLTEMMGEEAAGTVNEALVAAREAARKVVRAAKKEGDSVLAVVDQIDRDQFDKARFAFLDFADSQIASLPSINLQRSAELEM